MNYMLKGVISGRCNMYFKEKVMFLKDIIKKYPPRGEGD